MLLLTDKLNLTCYYALYDTKELLTITKMYINIIKFSFMLAVFPLSLSLLFSLLLSLLLLLPLSQLVSLSHSLSLYDGYVKLDTYLLKFLCHMTSDIKFFVHVFFIYLFFVQKLQHSMN